MVNPEDVAEYTINARIKKIPRILEIISVLSIK